MALWPRSLGPLMGPHMAPTTFSVSIIELPIEAEYMPTEIEEFEYVLPNEREIGYPVTQTRDSVTALERDSMNDDPCGQTQQDYEVFLNGVQVDIPKELDDWTIRPDDVQWFVSSADSMQSSVPDAMTSLLGFLMQGQQMSMQQDTRRSMIDETQQTLWEPEPFMSVGLMGELMSVFDDALSLVDDNVMTLTSRGPVIVELEPADVMPVDMLLMDDPLRARDDGCLVDCALAEQAYADALDPASNAAYLDSALDDFTDLLRLVQGADTTSIDRLAGVVRDDADADLVLESSTLPNNDDALFEARFGEWAAPSGAESPELFRLPSARALGELVPEHGTPAFSALLAGGAALMGVAIGVLLTLFVRRARCSAQERGEVASLEKPLLTADYA